MRVWPPKVPGAVSLDILTASAASRRKRDDFALTGARTCTPVGGPKARRGGQGSPHGTPGRFRAFRAFARLKHFADVNILSRIFAQTREISRTPHPGRVTARVPVSAFVKAARFWPFRLCSLCKLQLRFRQVSLCYLVSWIFILLATRPHCLGFLMDVAI